MSDVPPYAPAPVAPQPAPTHGPRGNRVLVLVAGGIVLFAAGVGAGWTLHGGTGGTANSPAASASSTAGQIALDGTLTLEPGAWIDTSPAASDADNDSCEGAGGYNDITAGIAVTIGDQSGATIGVDSLDDGQLSGSGILASCVFQFSVTVPAGESLYTVTISHRGTQTFTPDQVSQGVSLTLGGS